MPGNLRFVKKKELTVRDKMLTVDVVPVIVSKLLSMKRPRRRRKVSAARRRSRNPVHDRSRQKCRLLTSPLSSIVFTSSCTVDSNSYTPQLIAKYATTNISGTTTSPVPPPHTAREEAVLQFRNARRGALRDGRLVRLRRSMYISKW